MDFLEIFGEFKFSLEITHRIKILPELILIAL